MRRNDDPTMIQKSEWEGQNYFGISDTHTKYKSMSIFIYITFSKTIMKTLNEVPGT